ncbi:hypothetical protein L9G15_13065 [Shewanella sp. A3A]|nr:hypothetical protein [Shewanella ferrihydritica]
MMYYFKNTKISFDPTSADSVIAALSQYQTLLNERRILATRDRHYDVEFMALDAAQQPRRLQLSDVPNPEHVAWLQRAYSMGPEPFEIDEHIADDDDTHVSEALLFAIAIGHADNNTQLKIALRHTASALCEHARYYNDTSDMWIDDMRVYGVEALYLLGCYQPSLRRYLSQLLVPYWDDEHTSGYHEYLADYVSREGWNQDNIAAFIWCDNSEFRWQMFMDGESDECYNPPLIDALRQDANLYQWFKQILQARFLNGQMLARDDEQFEANEPVLDILLSALPLTERWDFDRDAVLEQLFVDASVEDTAYDLQQAISALTDQPLIYQQETIYPDNEDSEFDYALQLLSGFKTLLLAQPQGESLWRYWRDGSDAEQLKQLQCVDLLEQSRQLAPELYRILEDWSFISSDNASLLSDLCYHLAPVINSLVAETAPAALTDLVPQQQPSDGQQQLLRHFDLWFRLAGLEQVPDEWRDQLCERHELLSEQAFFERYNQNADQPEAARQQRFKVLLNDWQQDADEIHQETLNRLTQLLREAPKLACDDYWPQADVDAVDEAEQLATQLAYSSLRAWLLHSGHANEATRLQQQLSSNECWQTLLTLIANHCHGEDASQTELLQQLDAASRDVAALTQLLQTRLKQDTPTVGDLIPYHYFSAQQPRYELFENSSASHLILLCFWQQAHHPRLKQLWQVLLQVAPMRTLNQVALLYSHYPYRVEWEAEAQQAFCVAAKDAGVSSALLDAFQISICHFDQQPQQYQHWLEQMKRLRHPLLKGKAKALQQQLQWINEDRKIGFYEELLLRSPKLRPQLQAEIDHSLAHTLKLTLGYNLRSWDEVLLHDFTGNCQMLDYQEQQQLPAFADANMQQAWLAHDHHQWYAISISQQQGETQQLLYYREPVPAAGLAQGAENGRVLLFAESLDRSEIYRAIAALPDFHERLQQLVDHVLAYINGHAALADTLLLMQRYLRHDRFDLPRLYSRAKISELLPLLETEQQQRLLSLLFNFHTDTFELLDSEFMLRFWRATQLRYQRISYSEYLEQRQYAYEHDSEALENASIGATVQWLSYLDIAPLQLVKFALQYSEYESPCDWLVALARKNELAPLLSQLSADRRVELIDALEGDYDDAAVLLAPLAEDRSRRVRERWNEAFA